MGANQITMFEQSEELPIDGIIEKFDLNIGRVILFKKLREYGIPSRKLKLDGDCRLTPYYPIEGVFHIAEEEIKKIPEVNHRVHRETWTGVLAKLQTPQNYKYGKVDFNNPRLKGAISLNEIIERSKSLITEGIIDYLKEKEEIKPLAPDIYDKKDLINVLDKWSLGKPIYKRRQIIIGLYCLGADISGLIDSTELFNHNRTKRFIRGIAEHVKRSKLSNEKSTMKYLFEDLGLGEPHDGHKYGLYKKTFEVMLKNIACMDGIKCNGGYKPERIIEIRSEPWFKITFETYRDRVKLLLNVINKNRPFSSEGFFTNYAFWAHAGLFTYEGKNSI